MSYQVYNSSESSKTGSPKKAPVLRYEDLTSPVYPRGGSGGDDFNDQLRQKLSVLREENTELVTQSHRLLGELEGTSHQLLQANSKIEELKAELNKKKQNHGNSSFEQVQSSSVGPDLRGSYAKRLNFTQPLTRSEDRVGGSGHTSFQPNLKHSREDQADVLKSKLQQSLSLNEELRLMCSSHEREREKWKRTEMSLKDQLQDTQEECRRLVDSLSSVEEDGGRALQPHLFNTTGSSWDTPSRQYPYTSGHPQTAPPYKSTGLTPPNRRRNDDRGSLHLTSSERGSIRPDQRLNSRSFSRFPSDGHAVDYSTGSKSLPLGVGMASGRGSFMSVPGPNDLSVKLAESLAESRHFREKLEVTTSKLNQCEREVSFLESELKQKSHQSQQHIEDLVSLQSNLSDLKEQKHQEIEEVKKNAFEEVNMVKKSLNDRISGLEVQLSSGNIQLEYKDTEISRLRGELQSLQDSLDGANRKLVEVREELSRERDGNSRAVHKLSSEVDQGSSHVQRLEKALEQCQGELQEHLLRVQEDTVQQERIAQLHQKETANMAGQLKQSRSELQQHQNLLKHVQKELELTKNELSHCKVTEDRLSGEVTAYKELLKHRDHDKENLQADVVKLERELRAAREALVRKETEVGEQAKKMENKLGEVLNELKHVKTRNQELERGKSQMEMVRETLERRVTALTEDLERMQLKMDSAQSKERELVSQRNEAEGKVREKEAQVEGTIAQLKQELVQRSQQVKDLDALLRNHQAETASRRLQLERSLAQRQADLRMRTQEVEELTERLKDTEKALESSKVQLKHMSSEAVSKMENKVEVITKLQDALKELQIECSRHKAEAAHAKEQVEELRRVVASHESDNEKLTEQWRKDKASYDRDLTVITKELEQVKSQHSSQIQQLQDSHAQVLASRDQQSASHRLHVQRVQEQEKLRSEELARCRAQSAALSSELAAERKMNEEYQQQIALAKAEAARYQAQASSYQRALSMNNYMTKLNVNPSQNPSTASDTVGPFSSLGLHPSVSTAVSSVPLTTHSTSPVMSTNHVPLVSSSFTGPSNQDAHVEAIPRGVSKPLVVPPSPGKESVMSDLAEFYPLPTNLSPSLLSTPPRQTVLTPASTQIMIEHKEKSPKRGNIIDV